MIDNLIISHKLQASITAKWFSETVKYAEQESYKTVIHIFTVHDERNPPLFRAPYKAFLQV